MVFQNPDHQLLMPSCSSDLLMGMSAQPPAGKRRNYINKLLDSLGLDGLATRPIHCLSGGQKQRLAIAGALASGAGLLLLDEPTALLDPDAQKAVLKAVENLCHRRENPITALWITHRLNELNYADGAARMNNGCLGPWQSATELMKSLQG